MLAKKSAIALALISALAVTACQTATTPVQQPAEQVSTMKKTSASEQLNQLLEQHFAEQMKLNPVYATFVGIHEYDDKFAEPIGEASIAKSLAFEKKYLALIKQIDASQLSGQDWLSYQIFKRDRQMAIKGFEFESHLIPLNQMYGVHNFFAMLGSGGSAQPFKTKQDYLNFMQRAKGFAAYMHSAKVAMQQGVQKGMVLSKPLIKKVLPQLQAHQVDKLQNSVFYGPVKALADNKQIDEADKAALKQAYEQTISEVIIPAYADLYQYMAGDYLAAGRDTVGLSALPDGKAWYEYQIETNTTLPLSAQDIHQFGLQEVARILAEMKKVKRLVGFEGDLAAFFEHLRTDKQFYFESEQAVIDGYNRIKQKIDAKLPALFEVFPKSDYVVKPVEVFRAASSAGASYQPPSPDGSRPGVFYINTHDLKSQPKFLMETLSIHEASPGHHFQIAIQQEVEGLPMFRKFGGYTVFAEGWALYAESLGKELGLFTDPYMWYGRLADEQLRAMRLVVDTGLHAFGWTRQQAIDYMLQNSSMSETDVTAEVERYIGIPGQALAYKTGERHIRMLRNKAQQALGDKFDVKKFHTQILIDGALPMPILEDKIDKWIEAQQR